MRLSASRIRSINRAITRVQSSVWSASPKTLGQSASSPASVLSMKPPKFIKIVAVPRTKAS